MTAENIVEFETKSDDSIEALRRTAYGRANARVREANREQFEEFFADECEQRGIPYTRRLAPAEKAQQQIEALLAEFPELKGKV